MTRRREPTCPIASSCSARRGVRCQSAGKERISHSAASCAKLRRHRQHFGHRELHSCNAPVAGTSASSWEPSRGSAERLQHQR